jgi:uncharacterized protein (TIGR03083 family)
MRVVETAAHIEALEREGALFTDAARRAGPDAAVPSCPEWNVRDLVAHMCGVHEWANANLTRGSAEPMTEAENAPLNHPWPDDFEALLAAYRDRLAGLLATLRGADDDLVAWTFLPAPSPRAFWARRQALEIAMHRADAELATGPVTAYDAGFAADGIDEFVRGFAPRSRRYRSEPATTILIAPDDDPSRWLLEVGPEGLRVGGDGTADTTVGGSASDLFLWVWNRTGTDELTITGDESAGQLWRSGGVRWG